jgi:hypothetical protein
MFISISKLVNKHKPNINHLNSAKRIPLTNTLTLGIVQTKPYDQRCHIDILCENWNGDNRIDRLVTKHLTTYKMRFNDYPFDDLGFQRLLVGH